MKATYADACEVAHTSIYCFERCMFPLVIVIGCREFLQDSYLSCAEFGNCQKGKRMLKILRRVLGKALGGLVSVELDPK